MGKNCKQGHLIYFAPGGAVFPVHSQRKRLFPIPMGNCGMGSSVRKRGDLGKPPRSAGGAPSWQGDLSGGGPLCLRAPGAGTAIWWPCANRWSWGWRQGTDVEILSGAGARAGKSSSPVFSGWEMGCRFNRRVRRRGRRQGSGDVSRRFPELGHFDAPSPPRGVAPQGGVGQLGAKRIL